MSFVDLLLDQLRSARAAAATYDLQGDSQLRDWWRGRVQDLEAYLADVAPSPRS